MLKNITSLVLCICVFICSTSAQTNGILPFTGIFYFNEGIWGKYVDVSIDGATLINNRIPANKDFIIKLQIPTGFTEDAARKIYPAVEVSFLSAAKQVLSTIPNALKENEKSGFPAATYKEIPVKLNLRPEWLKAANHCIIQVRFFDLKSKKQLRLIFPVNVAAATEPLSVSKLANNIKTSDGSIALANAVKINSAEIMVDTSIRVAPKNAYMSMEVNALTGTTMNEVLAGKNSFWVYDKNMNEVKIADKLLKKVGGSMEDNLVNFTVKIPFRLKTDLKQGYTVRYRWESSTDKKKVIDVVTTK